MSWWPDLLVTQRQDRDVYLLLGLPVQGDSGAKEETRRHSRETPSIHQKTKAIKSKIYLWKFIWQIWADILRCVHSTYSNSLQESLEEAGRGREESDDRVKLLEELESLKEKKGQLEAEVQKYRDSDPELIEVLKKEIELSKQSANRYLFMSQAYVKSTNSKPFKITLD